MSFGFRPYRPFVLAGALAAGFMLTVAGCSNVTPLGPDAAATMPPPHQLRSPFVLQAMQAQPAGLAGGCPAGYIALAGNNGWCYRKIGTPATISSAAVSPVTAEKPNPPPGQQAGPAQYAFTLTLPASDVPALTAVSTTAAGVQGPLALSVDGQTWVLPMVVGPFTSRQFLVPLPSKNQALQLQRILAPSA
jgi:hypothetical protein